MMESKSYNRNQKANMSKKDQDRIAEYKRAFDKFDRNGDKKIVVDELSEIMKELEIEIDDVKLKKLVNF
jgi:Ca2+-binding EF-hand superfamily protein